MNIEIIDPWANPEEAKKAYQLNINKKISNNVKFNAVVCTVAHKEFKNMNKSDCHFFAGKKYSESRRCRKESGVKLT